MKIQRRTWVCLLVGLGIVTNLGVVLRQHHAKPRVTTVITRLTEPKGCTVAVPLANKVLENQPALAPVPATPAGTPRFRADQESALITAIYQTGQTDPIEALILAMKNAPVTLAGEDLIVHTAGQWATTDPQAAAEWAANVTDEALQARLLSGIATVWGEDDVMSAAALAVQSLPAGRQQDDAVVGIVQRWVQTQPATAAAWVLEFPEGSLRATALENLVKIWAHQNLPEATQWLDELAPGSIRDTAIVAYVSEIAPAAPTVALQWAESVSDAELREHQLAALRSTDGVN